MNLLKMNLRSIFQLFDHISEENFKAGRFSKKLAADVSAFCNLFSM